MALWKKIWLLFTVLWLVVAGLNIMTILVFSDESQHGKALYPATLAIGVPLVLYGVGWLWERIHKKR